MARSMSERKSVWHEVEWPQERPSLGEDIGCDVVVVGGGITGLTTALLLQRQGMDVALVESHRLGSGTTGHTTGKVTSQHGLIYADMIERHGSDVARDYAQANQLAVETVGALVEETAADCEFTLAPARVYARNEQEVESLSREHRAAVELGLPASMVDGQELPIPGAAALEFSDQVQLHPVRYCLALAERFERMGGRVYEGTMATGTKEAGKHVTIECGQVSVTAHHAVVATLLPFGQLGGLFARTRPSRAYGVAAKLADEAPAGMYISASAPTRSFRPWPGGGPNGLIIVGEGHETGSEAATPRRWGDLEEWSREHFEVESFEYRWSAQDFIPSDGIPYIGRVALSDMTLTATGFMKWGLSNGTAAALMLTDVITGIENPLIDSFDPTRIGDARSIGKLIRDNLGVGGKWVADRVVERRAPDLDALERGSARLMEVGGEGVAAYRDPSGKVHAVSSTCTHLGCKVHWNDAENTWDCPCHGSRFGLDGTVIEGPAHESLARLELPSEN